jgi:hypothetical protein
MEVSGCELLASWLLLADSKILFVDRKKLFHGTLGVRAALLFGVRKSKAYDYLTDNVKSNHVIALEVVVSMENETRELPH